MDFITPHFFSSLLSIIVIDLALAGDNAVVIALAARHLPRHHQRRAIAWGTAGALGMRIGMTVGVMYLLQIPALMLAGGIALIPIAWNLLRQGTAPHHEAGQQEAHGFWSALRTIIVADALMSLDNVLGIAGAANGHVGLVVIGLAISMPLVVWGSTLVLRLMKHFPPLIYLGAGVIAWTASRMIVEDRLLTGWFTTHPWTAWALTALLIVGVWSLGYGTSRHQHARRSR